MLKRISPHFISVIILSGCFTIAYGQPNWTTNLIDHEKKPAKFQNHQLVSEKMLPKKPTLVREFIENTFTHYNYYYNANNKINLVVARAEAFQKDNYTKLLPFYPYSFENTMAQKKDLDSVILKATAGILLHDLRNDWIDNMYLLLGEAYFYKKQFDSAAITFQFINYNLFPRHPRNNDEDQIVGTVDNSSNGALSIATKEKPNVLQKATALPPSRNDALIWLVRTFILQQRYLEAGGIINTLQFDPNLPDRLHDDLEEVDAFLFFQQGNYDSSAVHLERALSNAANLQDKARWEFLLAQMYELTHQFAKASSYYNNAATNTTNPLLNIYAELNNAKMLKNADSAQLNRGINNLLRMAKKDKFEMYRDIIYCAAGQLSMEKPDTTEATFYYNKSLSLSAGDTTYRNRVLVGLGDIAFNRKQYPLAFSYYDSLQAGDSLGDEKYARALQRTKDLAKIVVAINVIQLQDSLQVLANLSPADREAAVKKIAKRLRKEKGLKDEKGGADFNGGQDIGFNNSNTPSVDLFGNSDKGDWYFYDATQKAQGYKDFKSKWGDRTNTDNWRRKSATANAIVSSSLNPDDTAVIVGVDTTQKVAPVVVDMSYKGLMNNIPVTPDKLDASNTLLSKNLFKVGKLYQNNLEDYSNAITAYERSLRLFPDSVYNGEIYFNLYYCYHKLGDTAKMAFYKNILTTQLPDSRSAELLTEPDVARPLMNNPEVSEHYNKIYNLFIEGKFDSAISEKEQADTLYGDNYWSPQLLYIEAIYYIQYKCNDSEAIGVLSHIVKFYHRSKLAPQAQNLINVLRRRKEIEAYLSNLQVTRAKDDETISINDDTVVTVAPPVKNIIDSIKKIAPPAFVSKDSVKKVAPVAAVPANQFSFNIASPHYVIMVMDKVDNTYASEARNAFLRYNEEEFYGKQYTIEKISIDADHPMLIISPFTDESDAMQYFDKIKMAAPNEISWLPANKYYFEIISAESLQLLEKNKDLTGYKNLLKTTYPGKF
ncbi:MAG TPA: tetratricopeptide repeat protein [Ferruginibacter sp.]|nr:tetratricopeptide repeat protein [Ferruginibacter sp.]